MLLYNIRKAKYAHSLVASGVENRWNRNNEFVIYAGSSRALSALEMVVHRSSIQIGAEYKLLVIEVLVEQNDIFDVHMGNLPLDWQKLNAYPALQFIGSEWYQRQNFLLMKVPSVIVPQESNYVINTAHPDFKNKIKIKESEDFKWDVRLL